MIATARQEITIGDEATDTTGTPDAGRYESLRSLAAGLAGAITVDDVASVVAERAATVVGAVGCGVLIAAIEGESTRVLARHADAAIAPILQDNSALTPSALLASSQSRFVEFTWGDTPHTAAIFPALLEPGRPSVVTLIWEGPAADEEDVGAVARLCLAGLQRAWVTRRMRELGPITDALLDHALIGLAFLDNDLRYVHVNELMAGVNGHPPSYHRGRTIREVTPEIADVVEPILHRVLATGTPSAEIELTMEGASDTSGRVVVATFLPVFLDEDVVGVAVVIDDITEHRRQLDDLRQRYEFEREVATRLQRGLTPRGLPHPEGYEVAARYRAGSDGLRIGGDWYDLVEVDSERLSLIIGDVVGHGLDAALAMVRIRHALAGLSHVLVDPVQILQSLDDYATDGEDQFVATLVYGVLEPDTGRVTLSCAGHVPPLLISGGSVEILQTTGAPIGITAAERDAITVTLQPGDTLVLYTDGVVEERGLSVEAGVARLVAVVEQPFAGVEQLADRIATLAMQRDNSDDAAILVLKRL